MKLTRKIVDTFENKFEFNFKITVIGFLTSFNLNNLLMLVTSLIDDTQIIVKGIIRNDMAVISSVIIMNGVYARIYVTNTDEFLFHLIFVQGEIFLSCPLYVLPNFLLLYQNKLQVGKK